MSVKVASNRFIFSSIAKSTYQQINANVFDFHKLGARLSSHAKNLQAFRQTEQLEAIAEVLANLPLQEYKLKGQYYLAWCGYRKGQDTRRDFELIVEKSNAFREKGLLSLAGLEIARQDYTTAMKYYGEAIRWARTPVTVISAVRSMAIYKSDCGNNKEALRDLEALYPLVRYADPIAYYQYLNSLACELCEVGRIEEAQNVCRITLASPYVIAYPEWRETWQELALRGYKSRSVVSVPELPLKVKDNVVPIPVNTNPILPQKGGGKVFDLQARREQMVKEPNGEDENLDEMDFNELIVKLLQLTTHEELSEKKLRKVVKSAIKIIEEKD